MLSVLVKRMIQQITARLGYTILRSRAFAQLQQNAKTLTEAGEQQRRQTEALRADLGRLRNDLEIEGHALTRAREEIVKLKVAAEQAYDFQLLNEYQAKLLGFKDADPMFFGLYERVRACTMTSIEKLYAMYSAVRYLHRANISGDIVECGVWRGGSMMMAALTALALGDTSRHLFLFDTFEGHPEPNRDKDEPSLHDEWRSRRLTDQSSDWARASLDEVRRNIESTGYPMGNVTFVKGLVQDTVPANAPAGIALLRLDTDWYDSTACELKYLYPRLSDYGLLIIDDYGTMAGQRRAVDEYLAESGEVLLLNRLDFAGRLALKPARA